MTNNTNTGSGNTGDYNTSDYNTSDFNTGHFNTGHYNTGDCNTGDCNTGNRNTGDCNTGNRNTGDCNTGNRNTGSCNTGDGHVGWFNTVKAKKAYYFDRLIEKELWDKAYKPSWLHSPETTTWVDLNCMTPKEKADNPSYKEMKGCLRVNCMKTEWLKAYMKASSEDIQAVRDLPGFDYGVFEKVTGLDLRQGVTCADREVEIDGVTYVLKLKGETR